jgi:tetratricopeptide (TPR) repeat protein
LVVSEFRGVVNPADVVALGDAVSHFTESLKTSNDKGRLYQARGRLFLLEGRPAEAEEDFAQAILLSPNHEVFMDHAACLKARYDWTGAISDCDMALRMRPRSEQALRLRALACLQTENYEKAADDSTKALELRGGSDFELFSIRARSRLQTGDYDQVIADSEGMIAFHPDESLGFVLRSWAHYHKKQYEEALSDCAQAAKLHPRDFWISSQLAAIHAELGHLDEAVTLQKHALAMEPRNVPDRPGVDGDEAKVGLFQKIAPSGDGRLKEGRRRLDIYQARKSIKVEL